MAKEQHKGLAMVILGIVAVIAIVGLVLMFVQHKSATGKGIYGGAIKEDPFPYWTDRGVPQNRPQVEWAVSDPYLRVEETNWNYYGNPKRNPKGDIPSVMWGCGIGGMGPMSYQDALQYMGNPQNYYVEFPADKSGYCVYPTGEAARSMMGGVV